MIYVIFSSEKNSALLSGDQFDRSISMAMKKKKTRYRYSCIIIILEYYCISSDKTCPFFLVILVDIL